MTKAERREGGAVDTLTLMEASRKCGIKLLIAVPAAALFLAFIAAVIDHANVIGAALDAAGILIAKFWHGLLWYASCEGNFWGAIAITCVPLIVCAWACCVMFQIEKVEKRLVLIAVGSFLAWVVCFVVGPFAEGNVDNITAYQFVAVISVYVVPAALFGMTLVILAMAGINKIFEC